MKTLSDKLLEVLENNGFSCDGDVTEQDGEYYIEINQYTPEGQDWWETIWFDGTEEGFVKSVSNRANGFNVDEEAEIYIEIRGEKGVPDSIGDLMEDAEWKKETLQTLSRVLQNEELTKNNEPMTKGKFFEYVEEKFTLNRRMCLDLLESIYDYAEKNNQGIHNYILEELIGDALSLTENERKMICNVE